MASGNGMTTKGEKLIKPDNELVSKWVKDVWDAIPEDMVGSLFISEVWHQQFHGR